jgi:Cd2+/Zn2+-exporting ATPase
MEILKSLQSIGFTEYEAKIYLALLKENPSTGYQVSKNSGVPRSMVYDGLSRLHARGAVLETIEARATYYRPLPPNLLLDQHLENLNRVVSELKPHLLSEYEHEEDTSVWALAGLQPIYGYASQMLERASKEIFLVINDNALDFLYKPLESLSQKGIAINILLTGDQTLPFGNLVIHPPLESQMQGLTDILLLLENNTEVLVASLSGEVKATITRNPNIILIAHQFIWMEFFTQRIYAQLGEDLLERLAPDDRAIFESMVNPTHN